MPRPADKIFLKLSVEQQLIGQEDADDIWDELTRLEAEGEPTKARILCVELGFMDKGLARSVKHDVRAYLQRMVREESRRDRQVAGFELLERISSGAMGTVYRARHKRLNKTVALKVLKPDFADDASYVARFLQEARIAASLDHPNMVQAFDVGRAGEVHYIAMEFIDGKTVKDLVDRRGALDETAAVEIVLQILDALRHAHENSLVHRDVKPANIMITREGQAKLLDLGLVRRTDVESGLTGEGKAIGTPYYMAPEQTLDKGTDYRADFYALGCTLFNMVTGEKPYTASTPVGVMNAHLKAPIPSASERNPQVSTGLSQIIAKLLEKRPADRYQSHEDLSSDLTAVLSGFMPELKTGSAPKGMTFIRPRTPGGSGSRMGTGKRRGGRGYRSESGETPAPVTDGGPGMPAVIAIAAAAGLLLVGGLVMFGGDGGQQQVVANLGEDDDGSEEATLREEEARDRYQAIPRGEDRRRADALQEVAQRYPNTATGRQAKREADRIIRRLRMEVGERFRARRKQLDGMARGGDLQGAIEGYQALVRELDDADLRGEAEERVAQLQGQIERRVASLDAEAKELEARGDQRSAAAKLRESARLQPERDRHELLARADRLEARARQADASAEEEPDAAAQAAAQAELARLDALPLQLRELVRGGALVDALEAAHVAVQAMSSTERRQRAQRHVDALTAAVALDGLALEAFSKRTGEEMKLERARGSDLEGTLLKLEGEQLVIRLSARAEVAVSVTELADRERWRAIARERGARDPSYLRGVTALKLYRGDEDGEVFLGRCNEEGLAELDFLTSELPPPSGPIAMADPQRDPEENGNRGSGGQANGSGSGAGSGQADPQTSRDRYQDAVDRAELARRLIANRELLFTEADRVGYADDQLEPIYDFQDGQRFGKDWRLKSGTAYPAPPGQYTRTGLVLEGRKGRAEFAPLLHGNVRVRVRFTAQMLGRKSRFAIVLDNEEQRKRLSDELGQLLYHVKGRLKGGDGKPQNSGVRAQSWQVMELIRRGDTFMTKFNGTVVSELALDEDLGSFRLGLEWSRAALSLISIEVMCSPDAEWVAAKLE